MSSNKTATKKNFALIGAGGYIAPRHMKAIFANGQSLLAALDKSDSVGILDSYFPETHFFTEFERFDRHVEKLRRGSEADRVHFVSICSPNYLHDAHIRFSLRAQADAICEKPLVLNPWNVDALGEIERESGKNIYTILQLRLHPSIVALKHRVEAALAGQPDKVFDIDLTYLTSRGRWYFVSWKGDEGKAGGIATNIGVHFFDMLTYIFGAVEENTVHINRVDCSAGSLRLAHARVRWFLSVNSAYLPEPVQAAGQRTFRSITVDGEEIEFSGGFTDLHTLSYEEILAGRGFGLKEAQSSIELVHAIRVATPLGERSDSHPFCSEVV